MNQTELRQQITNEIITALEGNVLPWRRPWRVSPNSGRPTNVTSKRAYSGVNPLLLELHRLRHGLESKWWGTFRQWQALGLQVTKRPSDVPSGQWGAKVAFFKPVKKTVANPVTNEEEDERFFVLRTYTVFNADQVDGPTASKYQVNVEAASETPVIDYAPADQLIAATGADISHIGDHAFYVRPSPEGSFPQHTGGDYIVLPPMSQFDPVGSYFETAFHELSHWSEERVAWNNRENGYAAGELVAEIASCYLATELGVPQGETLGNHAAYLREWLTAMKGDASFIFRASKQASKVADYLLSFREENTNGKDQSEHEGATPEIHVS